MKNISKPLSVLAVLAVVLFGIGAGLSILPHVHGNDFDHSQHKSCPVYQIGLHSTDIVSASVFAFIVLFVLVFSVNEIFNSDFLCPFLHYFHLRAPPVIS